MVLIASVADSRCEVCDWSITCIYAENNECWWWYSGTVISTGGSIQEPRVFRFLVTVEFLLSLFLPHISKTCFYSNWGKVFEYLDTRQG